MALGKQGYPPSPYHIICQILNFTNNVIIFLCFLNIVSVQERANIEKEYAKQLKGWSSKWLGVIEKGE
jgi:hypothetical protein